MTKNENKIKLLYAKSSAVAGKIVMFKYLSSTPSPIMAVANMLILKIYTIVSDQNHMKLYNLSNDNKWFPRAISTCLDELKNKLSSKILTFNMRFPGT